MALAGLQTDEWAAEPVLKDGVPLWDECDALLRSPAFHRMDAFATLFAETNQQALRGYSTRWTSNPLSNWSRRWEYPYIAAQVARLARRKPRARILDAGSGATFLPWYLQRKYGVDVSCCDTDHSLPRVFTSVNSTMGTAIGFRVADVRDLPYPDDSFDMACCVSVLEHTDDQEQVVRELSRVSGGRVALTFDISLDDTRHMKRGDFRRLLRLAGAGPEIESRLQNPLILTAGSADPALLPWKGPAFIHRLKASVAARRLVPWPPLLTVCCLTMRAGRPAS